MTRFENLIGRELARGRWSWDFDRTARYALGVGCGQEDPTQELSFTTDNSVGAPPQVLPSFLSIMATGEFWMRPLGFRERKWEGMSWGWPEGMVQASERVTLLRALPPEGAADLSLVLKGVYDKGANALVIADTEIKDAKSGALLGIATAGYIIRGQGGFGGPRSPADEQLWIKPERAPDLTITHRLSPAQSLIFRLSGDNNPHLTDPIRAKEDGFDRPIYAGLGTFGFGCRALLQSLCDGDVSRFGAMSARFSQPTFPGDTLNTQIWRTETGAQFQCYCGERLVLDRGVFSYPEQSMGVASIGLSQLAGS